MTYLLKRPGRSLDKTIKYDRATVPLGLLAGASAVSSCADNIHGYAAIILGITTSIVYSLANLMMEKYEVEDPLENF